MSIVRRRDDLLTQKEKSLKRILEKTHHQQMKKLVNHYEKRTKNAAVSLAFVFFMFGLMAGILIS